MRIFCDTAVLVAASVKTLDHHIRAFPVIDRVIKGTDEGFIGMHSLAETYSSLSRTPLNPRIPPGEAVAIIKDSVLRYFKVQALNTADYLAIIEKTAALGLTGGMIYDALLLGCAEKVKPQRIYTFNLVHFQRVAPHLAHLIMAP
jgi:predicted nucleic acid-binding protein